MQNLVWAIAFFASLALPASAQVPETGIVECATIVEGSERLACYDAIASGISAEAQRVVTARAAEEARLAALRAAEAERIAAAAEADAEENARLALGAEQVTSGDGEAARDLDKASFVVAKVETSRLGKKIIELTNGQVWRQQDDRRAVIREGDEVTIKRGFISGYVLSSDRSRRTVRIERIR